MQDVFENIIEKLNSKKAYFQSFYECEGKTEHDADLNKATQLALDDAIEIVKQEAEQYNNGWIPCSSGNMPDDLGDVLIDMGGRQYIPAYFHNGEWYLTDCRGSSEKVKDQSRVKAWHPLPQSYQQKGE